MDSTNEAVREILVEGLDDWVPIDRLIGLTQGSCEAGSPHHKEETRAALRYLVGNSLIAVGELGEEGFECWTGSDEEITSRVLQGLDGFAWSPLGGFCWLANTDKGDELGRTFVE